MIVARIKTHFFGRYLIRTASSGLELVILGEDNILKTGTSWTTNYATISTYPSTTASIIPSSTVDNLCGSDSDIALYGSPSGGSFYS